MKQVVTQTRCMSPEANMAMAKQKATSGKSLVWNPLPNKEVSRLLTPVKTNMNTMLPSNPPSIVIYSVAANCCLNICITANIDIPSVREITLEITGDNPIFPFKLVIACVAGLSI